MSEYPFFVVKISWPKVKMRVYVMRDNRTGRPKTIGGRIETTTRFDNAWITNRKSHATRLAEIVKTNRPNCTGVVIVESVASWPSK